MLRLVEPIATQALNIPIIDIVWIKLAYSNIKYGLDFMGNLYNIFTKSGCFTQSGSVLNTVMILVYTKWQSIEQSRYFSLHKVAEY